MYKTFKPGFALCAAMLMSSAAFAQSTTEGGIAGTVEDPTSAVIPNAAVTIHNDGTNAEQHLTADGSGYFKAPLLDPGAYTVTIQLINGFSFGRPVWYMSMDSSDPTVAAIEHATYAPLMKNLPLGGDDSFNSPIERIFIADNGEEHCKSPRRQGLYATLTDGFRPNNTVGGIPTLALDYSPAWDITLYDWTPLSVSKGYRQQLREEFQILTMAQDGLITGFGGAPFGSFGVVNNCPIALRLD